MVERWNGHAPGLAAGLAVRHEGREEALQPLLVVVGLDEIIDRDDRVLVDQREHVGRQQHRGHRRRAALVRGERLDDGLLIGAGIDRLHLDRRVGLLEVGRVAVDDLGDRAADRDRIEERDFGAPCAIAGFAMPSRRCAAAGQKLSAIVFPSMVLPLRATGWAMRSCLSRCVGPMLHRTSARRQRPMRSTPLRRASPVVGRAGAR